MTDQWHSDVERGLKWGATLNLPALGQDEKHYRKECGSHRIEVVPTLAKPLELELIDKESP